MLLRVPVFLLRGGYKGIHPRANVALDLLLWLGHARRCGSGLWCYYSPTISIYRCTTRAPTADPASIWEGFGNLDAGPSLSLLQSRR